jgi:hypothetical protein
MKQDSALYPFVEETEKHCHDPQPWIPVAANPS